MHALIKSLRQWACSHEVFYRETMRRRPDGKVEATCHRCERLLVADYGLALPAKLCQRQPKPSCTPECGETACKECPLN